MSMRLFGIIASDFTPAGAVCDDSLNTADYTASGYLAADISGRRVSKTGVQGAGTYAAGTNATTPRAKTTGLLVVEGQNFETTTIGGSGQTSILLLNPATAQGISIGYGANGNATFVDITNIGGAPDAGQRITLPAATTVAVGVDQDTGDLKAWVDGVPVTSGFLAPGGNGEGYINSATGYIVLAALTPDPSNSTDLGVDIITDPSAWDYYYGAGVDWCDQALPAPQEYYLNATPTELLGIGAPAFPTRADAFTFEFTVLANGSDNTYGAAATGIKLPNSEAQTFDLTGGKKLYEMVVESLPDSNPSTGGGQSVQSQALGIQAFDLTGVSPVGVSLSLGTGNAAPLRSSRYRITGGSSTYTPIVTPLAGQTVAIGYDDATDEFVLFNNGSEIGRLTQAAVGADPTTITIFIEGTDLSFNEALNAGQVIRGKLNAIASKILSTYPAGWTDAYGNPVD